MTPFWKQTFKIGIYLVFYEKFEWKILMKLASMEILRLFHSWGWILKKSMSLLSLATVILIEVRK